MKSELKMGIILSYVSMILGYVVSLFYTPILLRFVGQSDYGLYSLVTSIVSYLGLLTMGFGSSYMRYYSKFRIKNQIEEIKKLNGTFLVVFSIIAGIAIIIGGMISISSKEILGNNLSEKELIKASILLKVLTINTAISFINTVFDCYVIAHEKYTYQKIVQMIKIVLNPLIVLPLVYIGYGIVALGIVSTALNILLIFFNIYYCIKILEMKFSIKNITFSFIKELFSFSFYIFLYMIIDQINWNVDKMILGRVQGTKEVAIYSVGTVLNSYALQLSLVISSVFVPRVNNLVAENPYSEKLSDLFIKIGRGQYILMTLVATGFIFFGESFIYLWAGNGFYSSYMTAVILMIPMVFVVIQNLGIEIRKAQNKHKIPAFFMLGVAILNIIFTIPLAKKYGSCGSAIGTSLAIIINQIFINIYYTKVIKLNIKLFWKKIIILSKSFVLPIIFGVFLLQVKNKYSDMVYMLYIIPYIVIYVISIFLFGLEKDEKSQILNKINDILRRKI